MKKRVRFTPEQKEKMKTRTLAMLNAGHSQQHAARTLGTTVTTIRKLIKGAEYPGRRKGGSAKTKKPGKGLAGGTHGPVAKLAQKHARLEAIERQIAGLLAEQAALKKEMKTIYDRIGKVIFKQNA